MSKDSLLIQGGMTFLSPTSPEFQAPKMEVLNPIFGYFGVGFPLHTAYIGEYPHFRYLKYLVTNIRS